MNYLELLRKFQKAAFLKTGYWPADINQKFIPGNTTAMLRAFLHDEEVTELEEVLEDKCEDTSEEHLLKELCDVLYVVFGTIACYNLPVEEAFKRVHENNMLKLTNGTILTNGKWQKPKDHSKVELKDLFNNE